MTEELKELTGFGEKETFNNMKYKFTGETKVIKVFGEPVTLRRIKAVADLVMSNSVISVDGLKKKKTFLTKEMLGFVMRP